MCQIYNVTFNICTLLFFIIFKSLRSSVSEGILAVDERMSKQEDIRKKKVRYGVYPKPWFSAVPYEHCGACGSLSLGTLLTSCLCRHGACSSLVSLGREDNVNVLRQSVTCYKHPAPRRFMLIIRDLLK